MVESQTRQIVCETLSQKTPSQKGAGGVAQDVGPEFKPQDRKKNQTKKPNVLSPKHTYKHIETQFKKKKKRWWWGQILLQSQFVKQV
jgi:hypothetical protein